MVPKPLRDLLFQGDGGLEARILDRWTWVRYILREI